MNLTSCPWIYTSVVPAADALFLTIRSISAKAQFGFILVGGEKMESILSCQGDALNKFQAVRVDYFDRNNQWMDYQELVRRPVLQHIDFTEEAIHELYEQTAGNPYFTVLLCRELYKVMVARRDNHVSGDEVREVVQNALSELRSNSFQHFWEDGIFESGANAERV